MSLRVQFGKSIKWTALSQFGRQGLQYVTMIVLANLISPSDFGLMGMAMVVVGFSQLFNDLGTSAAIIQRRYAGVKLLETVFWSNCAISLVFTSAVLLLAPLLAFFFGEPELAPLLRVMSISFLLSGPGITHKAVLEKRLAFNKLAGVELAATLLSSAVAVSSAIGGNGVWSLVYQAISYQASLTMLLWAACPWRPRFRFHWKELRGVMGFSLNLVGFNVFNYFARNADYILIGRFLGSEALGYYSLAYRIMLYPIQNISTIIGRVMFPTFSLIQDDNEAFRRAYLQVISAIGLLVFPLFAGLLAVAGPFVDGFFGAEWGPVAPLLMILAPVGMSQCIGTTVGTIYQAKGRTDWMFLWGMLSGTIIVGAFAIGLHWGINGVAVSYLCTLPLAYPGFAIPFRLIELPMRDFLRAIYRPLLFSVLMALTILGARYLMPSGIGYIWLLAACVAVGIFTYAALVLSFDSRQVRDILDFVRGS